MVAASSAVAIRGAGPPVWCSRAGRHAGLARPGPRLTLLEGDSPLGGQRARKGERPPAQSFASPAEALLIEEAELGLCGRISLIGGEPENSRCRPLDLRKPAAAGVLGRFLRRKLWPRARRVR